MTSAEAWQDLNRHISEHARTLLAPTADRLMPLTRQTVDPSALRWQDLKAGELFPATKQPDAALAGTLLIVGEWDGSHQVAQNISSPEGSYWHAIAHRMEPDIANAGWWFGQFGAHPVFPMVNAETSELLGKFTVDFQLKADWNPRAFLRCFESAIDTHSPTAVQFCREVQQAECRLLLHWCVCGRQ